MIESVDQPLPFSSFRPLLAGALFGVLLRLAFYGDPGEAWTAMAGAFVFLVPLAVGAVTVFLAERSERRSWGYYAYAGFLSNVMFVCGTLLIMIEGLICAIVIVPLLATIGMVGALVMGAVCRLTRWPKQVTYCLAVLPLLVGGVEPSEHLPIRVRTIERSVVVAAPKELVWAQLFDVRDIRSHEVERSIAHRIGVPAPISARVDASKAPGVRQVTMGKHVHFDQIELERREFELIRWRQRFHPGSFPPNAFDQHVVMGGDYFDVEEVAYALAQTDAGTQLTVRMRYRVSTRFNWYADAVARLVLGNLESTLLDIYRTRAEARR
jgi:hypothetical protein